MFYSRKIEDLYFSFYMQEDYKEYNNLFITSTDMKINCKTTIEFLTIPETNDEEKNHLKNYYGETFEMLVKEFFRDRFFLIRFGL